MTTPILKILTLVEELASENVALRQLAVSCWPHYQQFVHGHRLFEEGLAAAKDDPQVTGGVHNTFAQLHARIESGVPLDEILEELHGYHPRAGRL